MAGRPSELVRALAVLGEPPGAEHAAIASALGLPNVPDNAAYSDVFLFQLYPYASVYLGTEGMMGGDAADRIAGFWSALGRVPPKEPDHLSGLLALYADLVGVDADSSDAERVLRSQAARALLQEHLAPWVFGYLSRFRELTSGFYAEWAEVLAETLVGEVAAYEPAQRPPVHLRESTPVPDPRSAEPADFLGALLAPVRSGVILSRADLGRLAQDLDLGLRAGERRYALEHFLGAEAGSVLEWLASEALRQSLAYDGRLEAVGPGGPVLQSRARATAELCRSLAKDADMFGGAIKPEDRERASAGAQS